MKRPVIITFKMQLDACFSLNTMYDSGGAYSAFPDRCLRRLSKRFIGQEADCGSCFAPDLAGGAASIFSLARTLQRKQALTVGSQNHDRGCRKEGDRAGRR